MTKEQLEHLMENRDGLGLAMLRHCIYLAKTRYGWTPDQMLPQGRDPETVVDEVMQKYFDGERTLAVDVPIEAQLKEGVRSWLSSIYARKDSKALTLDRVEEVVADEAGPAVETEYRLDYERLIGMVLDAPEVQKSDELQLLVMAVQDGSENLEEQSEATGLPVDRIYELRKKLRKIIPRVLDQYNKGDEPK